MASEMRTCAFALACAYMLLLGGINGHYAGERNILQTGANTVNNSPGLLAPAPGASSAPSQPIVNVTTRSFFVLTAASGSLSRTMNTGDNTTNGAILILDNIDQQVTWYSEAPIRQSGAMEASTFANTSFFQSASAPSSSWLNDGNMAVSYTDANTSARGTTVLAISAVPDVLKGGSSWRLNVTINSDSDTYTRVVTSVNTKAQAVHEPLLRKMTHVSAFFSGACYNYNRNSGEVSDWYFCTYISRSGSSQYS